jgi:hypothetical protein
MQQTEAAYWQGEGSLQNAPAPWTALSNFGDPDFSWRGGRDQKRRMGLATNIDGGSGIFLCAAAFWTFFHGETQTRYNFPGKITTCEGDCIANQIMVTGNPKSLHWYGVNTRCTTTIILDGRDNPKELNNPGGVVAGYLKFSGA